MCIQSATIHVVQSNQQQSILNLARPHSQGGPKVLTRLHRYIKGAYEEDPSYGIRSTCPKPPTVKIPAPPNVTIPPNAKVKLIKPHDPADISPPQEANDVDHIFCLAALADQTATLTSPMDTQISSKGFKPKFNILNNEASAAITEYLCQENIKWQFVPPNEYHTNAAEHAIQTFKNHLVSGLCSTDHQFLAQLWAKLQLLLPQVQDSLNIFRASRIDPSKSAYQVLEGIHDFNHHPWAPPGCRAAIHEPANNRTLWGPRGPMLGT
ncbi:hypothetical protein ACHAXN_002039 [Cyclotella atomus]